MKNLSFRGNLLIQFSAVAFIIMLLLAIAMSSLISSKLTTNIEHLEMHDIAMHEMMNSMTGDGISDELYQDGLPAGQGTANAINEHEMSSEDHNIAADTHQADGSAPVSDGQGEPDTHNMTVFTINDSDPFSIHSMVIEVQNLIKQTYLLVGAAFIFLYGSLVTIVWRGWKTINQQQIALTHANDALQNAHVNLEQKVETRTIELQETNQLLQQEILERKRMEESLIFARDKALEVSRLKSEILARVSHELRTPLSAILGYTEMIRAAVYGPITEEQFKVTDKIVSKTQNLTNLVSELLTQAQLESGKLILKNEPFAPEDLVIQTQETMSVLAKVKGLSLNCEVDDTVPPILIGDSLRIQQIVTNLVGNAIKFTDAGHVNFCIYQPEPSNWVLEVKDTGPGIPVEDQADIFDSFIQTDGSITRKHDGFGLGLSIVKQLTSMMEGNVKLESRVGQGTTFTISLPLVVPQENGHHE